VGVDSAWEQEKLEAWKMLENATDSQKSAARFVRCLKKFYQSENREKEIPGLLLEPENVPH
jgi:hypothetical protein